VLRLSKLRDITLKNFDKRSNFRYSLPVQGSKGLNYTLERVQNINSLDK